MKKNNSTRPKSRDTKENRHKEAETASKKADVPFWDQPESGTRR
jgi:hypothetical protein